MIATKNMFNSAVFPIARPSHYAPPDYYTQVVDGILYRYDNNDWDYCQIISLSEITPGFSYAHACGDSQLPQIRVVRPRPIPVRDAPLRPSDAEEAACYRRAQAMTRSKRVYKFVYGQQRLFIDGVPCQGPLTRSQAKKKRVFSLNKIFERKAALKEQLRLERFERLWGKSAYSFLKSLGYKKVHIAPYVPFPALPTSVKQVKNCTRKSAIDDSLKGTFISTPQAIRDSELAYKLRQLIKSFRPTLIKRSINTISLRDCVQACYIPRATGQMDQGAHGTEDSVESVKVSNTVITTHNEESVGAAEPTVLNWHSLTTTDPEQEYVFGTERWCIYKVLPWNKNTETSGNLDEISMPTDLMKQCWNQPAMAVFKNNRYWRSDIEFRFQLNTNKFQSGSLQCSYIYDCDKDASLVYRANVYGLSQTNHCILDASGSNMGTLYIPYKYNNPYLNTDNDKEYVKVFIKVLNHLECPSTVYGSASLTVYYRFVNAKFMGTLDTSLVVRPQMLTLMRALGAAAEAGLRSVNKDLNRDKPPEPSAPLPATLRSTSSWCIGTNLVEPTNLLRLDSSGQTPHPNLKLSSMLVKDLVNIYGLVLCDQKWNTEDEVGHLLQRLDAAPLWKLDNYGAVGLDWPVYPSADTAYALPPIAVVSSLFTYWRGTMDLRIDIVGTPFHKGQLLISYIPRNHLMDEVKNQVTLEMAKSSNYTICDLSETRSFTINIPYISSRPMYPLKYSRKSGNDIPPPGYLSIFVLNPLIPMDNVSKFVYINYYLKAGKDFELLVPRQPSIGLPYDPSYKPEPSNIVTTNKPVKPKNKVGLLPFDYTDSKTILYVSGNMDSYQGNVITDNYTMDFAIRVPSRPWFTTDTFVLRLINPVQSNLIKDRGVVVFKYCGLIDRGDNLYVLVPIEKEFIKMYPINNKNKIFTGLITMSEWCSYYNIDGSYADKNLWAKTHLSIYDDYVLKVPAPTVKSRAWLNAAPEMDERVLDTDIVTPMSGSLLSTSSGLTILGENFSDLKNLCRRYQKLFNQIIMLDNSRTDKLSVCFPVSPMGIINNSQNFDSTIPEVFNRCRDGIIPLITSGYRYWRGSMRFRIMTDNKVDLNIIVQHRPDVTSSLYNITQITDNVDRNSYLNHGYSMVIQNLSVNNCVDIEVPWYNPNMLASCHQPNSNDDLNNKYSLGSIFIGFNNNSGVKSVGLSVYYSIGDDFRFDSFQGFPCMVSVNKVAIAQPQMFSTIKGWINLPSEIKKANQTAENFNDHVLPKIKKTLQNEVKDSLINVYEILCDLASQLVHCMINPNIKTILWSIFSVFVKFGLLTIKCATKLVQLGIKILGFTVGAVCSPIKKSAFGKRFAFNGKHLYYRGVCLPQECCYNIPKAVRLLKYIDKHETRGIPVCCTKPIDPKDTGFAYDLALDKELLKAKLEVNKDNEVLGSVKRPEVPLPDELVDQLAKEYPQILNPFFGEEDDEEDLDVPSSSSDERASVQNGEDAEEVAASMVSIIYSSICVLLNFTCTEKKDFKSFVPVLMKGMGTTASGANNIFRFIKNNFKLFNILYEKVMYNKYWALKRYRILETEDMDLNKWANSVSVLLQPKFRTFIDNKQLWRDAVFGAARYGFLYLTENTKNPQKNTAIDPFIRKLYEQIVRLRDELQTQKLFPSLRQEAFSMWIFGPAGVGKSTLVDDLTTRMLKAISFTHINELKYTISPVTKHWDGCNQQPVIVIDDAFAVDEPEANAAQLWAYFQICSPIPLRPPMAKLEDKSMTYNPEIFVSCANTAFPRITMLRTEEALFRRRHLLIETRLNPDTTTKPDYPFGLSAEQVANYEHIQFRLAVTPRSRQTQYMAWMDFNSLVNYCIDKFKEFKIKSKITYEARHALHYSLYPTDLDIPEEATLRSLYTKDNEERKAGSEQVCDTFGITLADTKATLKEVGETIKQLPSDPANPVHPSISAQAMDLAFKSLEECSIPLSLSEVLNMGKHAETNTAQQQMKDVQTLTQYMGLGLRQADLCSKVLPDVDQKRLMLMECDEMIKESGTDDNETILLGASDDFISFEETLKSKLGTFFDCNEDIATRFVVMPVSKLSNAPKVNEQILGPPLLNKILEDNCLHMLLDRDTPMIKSDCGKYLSWLIEYDNRVFSIYDCPCKANNCVLKLPDNDSRYIKFVSFVYAWYSNNYNLIKNVHTKFVNNGGVNFLFLTHFSYIERYVLAQRNIVVNAIRRYKDLGLWKGYILPGAHWLGGWLKKIYSTLHTVLGICGMLSIGYFTYKMWNPTPVPTKTQRSKGQLISSGDSGTHNRPNNTRLIVSKKLGAKQQLNDHCLSSVIRRRIHNNTVYIEFTDNSTQRQAVMKCLIIKGRNMLVIKHYYDYLSTYTNENSECYLCWNDVGRIPFDYTQLTWNWFNDSNFGLVELPRTVSERKSLIPFIATEHQANTNISPNCDIIDINTDAMKIFSERVSYCGTVVIEPSRYSEELVMNGCWRYGRNYPGMCGSILMSTNLTTPIIGMHVAGGNGFGYSEPLTREMFSELDKQTDGPVHEYRELDLPIVPVEQRKVYLTGSHRYAGNIDADILKTDIKLAKVESGVSKIVPSLLYGTYPILTEPGPLTPKDPRLSPKFSPLVEGCEKMCNPTYEFDAVDVAQSEEDLLQKLLSCVKPLRLNVNPLTVEQALNGIPDLEGYDHINWDTSEGFPLSRIRPPGARNKRWLFEFNNQGKAIKIHDALQTILEDKMKDRMNGIVPVTLHDDCLKDARIPIEKINIPGKTRIFSISPVDFTIHFRQYYLDFIAAYGAARFRAEHAIGINVHGLEWTDLANLVGSDHMITGDYSGFGPTLNTEILHAAFRVIFKWYQYHDCSEQSHKIRYIMSREICNALHLMNDYVYQTSCGMPSGNPGTVIFNSLVNSLYIRCAYLKIMRRTLYSGLYCFNRYVTLVTYGDDLIAKLHPNIIEHFNFNSLSQFFFTKNLKFTDAAKTGIAVEPTMPLNKATFLKHCFNPHPFRNGIYLAGLDKVSITECVNWVRKSPDMKDATYQNCNQATMLSYGWGPEYFNDLVATIRKEWRDKFDEYFQCRTWEELDTLFLDENWDPNLKW